MNHNGFVIRAGITLLLFLTSIQIDYAQKNTDQWLRVITGEESTVDINRTSLQLESNYVIRARFRTALVKEEPVPDRPGIKYQIREDSIQFNLTDGLYRVAESTLISASGKVVSSSGSDSSNSWKPWRGRTARLLLSATSQLAPFGNWRVVSYHYTSGEGPSDEDPRELRALIGSTIVLKIGELFIGNSNCPGSTYEATSITDSEAKQRLGISLKDLGADAGSLKVIQMGCHSNKDYPPQTLVFVLSPTKAKVLWDGVFLDVERLGTPFLP